MQRSYDTFVTSPRISASYHLFAELPFSSGEVSTGVFRFPVRVELPVTLVCPPTAWMHNAWLWQALIVI
jgi:hypothetical protein